MLRINRKLILCCVFSLGIFVVSNQFTDPCQCLECLPLNLPRFWHAFLIDTTISVNHIAQYFSIGMLGNLQQWSTWPIYLFVGRFSAISSISVLSEAPLIASTILVSLNLRTRIRPEIPIAEGIHNTARADTRKMPKTRILSSMVK
jgi:hypothetical protein